LQEYRRIDGGYFKLFLLAIYHKVSSFLVNGVFMLFFVTALNCLLVTLLTVQVSVILI